MSQPLDTLGEVAEGLRSMGLSVRTDGARIHVGTEHRGDAAPVAVVELPGDETSEYLADVAENGPRPGCTPNEARGYLGTLVLELVLAVHDGESNLTDRVFLRRGPNGRLGLTEHRITGGGAWAPPGSGPLMWTAERPEQ